MNHEDGKTVAGTYSAGIRSPNSRQFQYTTMRAHYRTVAGPWDGVQIVRAILTNAHQARPIDAAHILAEAHESSRDAKSSTPGAGNSLRPGSG